MGCFDYTYADNGHNIQGGTGWMYLSKAFCEATGLPSPVRFLETDQYGRFCIRHPKRKEYFWVDICQVHTCELWLFGEKQIADEAVVRNYLSILNGVVQGKPEAYNTLADFTYGFDLREGSIHLYFKHMMYADTTIRCALPKLGNQDAKSIVCKEIYTHPIPVMLTKKKLPTQTGQGYLEQVAKDWGCVSGSDPNQGFRPTSNYYVKFAPIR